MTSLESMGYTAGRLLTRIKQIAPEAIPDDFQWSETTTSDPIEQLEEMGVESPVCSCAIADILGVSFQDQLNETPSSAFISTIPISFAREYNLLGIDSEEGTLVVAVCDLKGWQRMDVVGRFLRCQIQPLFVPRDVIRRALNTAYEQRSGQTEQLLQSLDGDRMLEELNQLDGREDLLDVEGRAPVIKLVNHLLADAVTSMASDIHIQPYENRLMARMRIDGILFDIFDIPKPLQDEVISRFKVMGQMNIAEKRLPQDGRATAQVGDRLIDLRIASMPTSHGERVVVRLLDKSARLYSLSELGMQALQFGRFSDLIHVEHGLILVTGPTGSGKSTTLYAALQQINATDKNVVTLEDPIEYQLDGISQTQINVKKGMTFASGLRSVLRQDPDIIMLGEIRDGETAVMAIQSALTGHLVFSTLHTNDAASAVTRMLDLGIEPYLVSSSLITVLAQRLVRKICDSCKEEYSPPALDIAKLGLDRSTIDRVWRGAGCEACRGTGYQGRLGLYELLVVNDDIRSHIQQRSNAAKIRDAALVGKMGLLREDGIRKALAGETTIEEVMRVTMRGDL